MSLTLLVPSGAAQESAGEAYGLVKSIEGNRMTVAVVDPSTNAVSDQVFTLSPETRLVIVRPAAEVVVGDEVRISYESGNDNPAEYVSILDLPKPETPSAS